MGTVRISCATLRTASRSPREEIGKPASITSTLRAAKLMGHADFLRGVHGEARRLLAIAQGGVEDANYIVHREIPLAN